MPRRSLTLFALFYSLALAVDAAQDSRTGQQDCQRQFRHRRIPKGSRKGQTPKFNKTKQAHVDLSVSVGNSGSSQFKLVSNFQGNSFFDNFNFFTDPDPTHGTVNYVNDPSLAYVNHAGHAIMRVDNSSDVAGNRNSVRVVSKGHFQQGQMLVFDAIHMPTGCATWPAFWVVGPQWPQQGEIDIVEGVNTLEQNQYTLHTSTGCTLSQPMDAIGQVLATNCDAHATGNVGCGIQDPRKNSYGPGFNSQGGGVYVTLWDDSGIRIWFFSRSDVPQDIKNETPNPDSWGQPVAAWSSATCSASFFTDLLIVINTTLCGDWAGSTFGQDGCPGTCADYVKSAGNFREAYWEIASVKTYGPR